MKPIQSLCHFKLFAVASIMLAMLSTTNASAESLKIVTTLPTFASITETIGGNHVSVKAIASPRFNPHFIQPRPSDVLSVKRCDLFIHGGLDLEAWRQPLLNAAARSDIRTGGAKQLDLSNRIRLLEVPRSTPSRAEGDIHLYGNPHYWLQPENGRIIAEEITEKLIEMDKSHEAEFRANLKSFSEALQKKEIVWKDLLSKHHGEKLIGYHDEWIYLVSFLGLTMDEFLEPKPGIPPTPQHLEMLKDYIRDNNVRAILQANFYPKDAGEKLAKSTGIKLLLLSQGVGDVPASKDYLSFLDFNVATLTEALNHE